MSSSNIFVLGSTGFVGNAVLASLSKYANGRPIYAGIRNPNAEKALAIAKLEGVTVTKADMGESVETLTRQLAGKVGISTQVDVSFYFCVEQTSDR